MDLFRLPRVVGTFEDKEIKVNIGRFGPYILHNNAFTSLKKEDDPYEVSLERCIELIKAKRISDAEKILKTFQQDPELKIIKGRWGPFISRGKENFRIPKGTEYEKLTYEDVLKIVGPVKEAKVVKLDKKVKGAKKENKSVKKAAAKKPAPRKVAAKKVSTKKSVKKSTVKKKKNSK
jgi:DNA topoisomerase-1